MSDHLPLQAAPALIDLIMLALDAHEFLIELPRLPDVARAAACTAAAAAQTWAHEHEQPIESIPRALILLTAWALQGMAEAEHALLDAAAERAAAELADAIEHGDLDDAGNWIPYPTYRSA